MRVLILSRYGPLGASSRLRTMQYVPYLREAGHEVEVAPLLGDEYVRGLYAGKISPTFVAKAYWDRFLKTRKIPEYDVIWLEKEAWPWIPGWLEIALLRGGARLIVDYDDAIFHRYDEHRLSVVRTLLGRKIDRVMRRADLVTAGNEYLAARARAAGAGQVAWLPTVVDLERYPAAGPRSDRERESLIVGWIGSPSTAGYLREVSRVLAPLHDAGRVRCVAIGARPDQVEGTPFEARQWREDSEVELLRGLDIGIMPLPDAPWERGKCGYKLIQYMACELPVVASPVGVNRDLVRPGRNGFLAQDPAEWREAFDRLLSDAELRTRLGAEGRRLVEETYCLQVQSKRLLQMLSAPQKSLVES